MRCISFLALLWSGLALGAPIRLAFDWDDNVAVMPTKVYLIHRVTGAEWPISSAEFAKARLQLGVAGSPYEAFTANDDFEKGSHRDFADRRGDGVNRFLEHLQASRPGPQWEAFVEALSRPETAAETGIVSARMHEPETILEGLRWLQAQGRIRYLPPVENLWCVRHPDFPVRFRDTFGDLPDEIVANGTLRKSVLLERYIEKVAAAGERQWRYSDDDWGTFQQLRVRLSRRVEKGEWPLLTLQLEFTGHNILGVQPHALILQASAAWRNRHALESFARVCR